jgi:hypothetical protein
MKVLQFPKPQLIQSVAPGQVYDDLYVMEKTDRRQGGHVIWQCRCQCGRITYVTAYRLRFRVIKSCGKCRKGQHHEQHYV